MADVAKWCNEGENWVVSWIVSNTLYLGLYMNTTEPDESATLASITEPSSSEYARKQLDPSSWSVSGSVASYPEQHFSAISESWGEITGYFLTDAADSSGKLIAILHFDSPFSMDPGNTIYVTPHIEVS